MSPQKLSRKILIPIAITGLKNAGIASSSIEELLGIIDERVRINNNGAKWMLNNFSNLLKGSTANEASYNITSALYHNQMTSKPVHTWGNLKMDEEYAQKRYNKVRYIMTTELFIAQEDDIVELAINMMDWKNIRSIPVENHKNEIVGLVTARELLKYHSMPENKKPETDGELMERNFKSIAPSASTHDVAVLMAETKASCILVVVNKHLAGLVCESDIVKVAKHTNIFKR